MLYLTEFIAFLLLEQLHQKETGQRERWCDKCVFISYLYLINYHKLSGLNQINWWFVINQGVSKTVFLLEI